MINDKLFGLLQETDFFHLKVCSLLWSSEYKELVSAHGHAKNEVVIWKYPSMVKTAELLGHTDRVLHLAMSADETTVVTFFSSMHIHRQL